MIPFLGNCPSRNAIHSAAIHNKHGPHHTRCEEVNLLDDGVVDTLVSVAGEKHVQTLFLLSTMMV